MMLRGRRSTLLWLSLVVVGCRSQTTSNNAADHRQPSVPEQHAAAPADTVQPLPVAPEPAPRTSERAKVKAAKPASHVADTTGAGAKRPEPPSKVQEPAVKPEAAIKAEAAKPVDSSRTPPVQPVKEKVAAPQPATRESVEPVPTQSRSLFDASVAVGPHFQQFSFGPRGDVDVANLLLLPFSFQRQLGPRMALDGYTAYAQGTVHGAGKTYTLSGPVDSWIRLRWATTRWAVFAVGLSLPTGVARHNEEQAAVANVLTNEFLGFREGNWGGGGSATVGFSTAGEAGAWRVTSGVSYRATKGFHPTVDSSLFYTPGNELRGRIGLERMVRGAALALGFTGQHFTVDQANHRNIFQSGDRYRTDVALQASDWLLFGSDLWRGRGDLTIPIIDLLDGSFMRDTSFTVGWQHIQMAGASRTFRLGNDLLLIPSVDAKVCNREDRAGRGWMMGAGITVPFHVRQTEFFPALKVTEGSLIPSRDVTRGQAFWGLEMGLVVRRAFRHEQSPELLRE